LLYRELQIYQVEINLIGYRKITGRLRNIHRRSKGKKERRKKRALGSTNPYRAEIENPLTLSGKTMNPLLFALLKSFTPE